MPDTDEDYPPRYPLRRIVRWVLLVSVATVGMMVVLIMVSADPI